MIIPDVIQQHVEESAILHGIRTGLTRAPHARLRQLKHFDERLLAHLEGVSVAGSEAWPFCEAGLELASAGRVFTAAVRALEDRHTPRLERLIALTQAVPETSRGLTSAYGWLEPSQLHGMVAPLLHSTDPFRRMMGVAACAVHRVSAGTPGSERSFLVHPVVRARWFRSVGELGMLEAMPLCESGREDDDQTSRFWAAWAAVMLGSRGGALETVVKEGLAPGPNRARALRLALQAMSVPAAHGALQGVAGDPTALRWLIQGSGVTGDPGYAIWLIGHMANDQYARLAGEAFSLITGTDLAALDLERKPPEDFESVPNNNPDDANVDMDPDDGLPWPHPEKIKAWWAKNCGRFQPGTRYFMGQPVTREHCIEVLKNGYQRQRILAAHYLCLLDPGTPLFNTSAPAWRQQKLLAAMK
jgi:uncharacterized protein (TIGR02270 family)